MQFLKDAVHVCHLLVPLGLGILVGLLCLAVPAAVQLLDLTVKGVQGALNLVRLVLDVGGKLLDGGKRYLDVFAH